MDYHKYLYGFALLAIAGWISMKTWERASRTRANEKEDGTNVLYLFWMAIIDIAAVVNVYLIWAGS